MPTRCRGASMRGMTTDRTQLVERYLRGETDVVEPRDAATVVLLRDGPAEPEVYLLRRRPTMAFAAGVHVFPGGAVDPRDADGGVRWVGPPPAAWAQAFSCDVGLAGALVCAAVRETFEESGVLLAADEVGTPVIDTTGDDWERDRLRTHQWRTRAERRPHPPLTGGARRPAPRLGALGLPGVAAAPLRPPLLPRRPAGMPAHPDVGGEADRVAWLPVAEAFAGFRSGSLAMMNATASMLRDLSAHSDMATAMAAPGASSRSARPLLSDGRLIVYDGEHGPAPLLGSSSPEAGRRRGEGRNRAGRPEPAGSDAVSAARTGGGSRRWGWGRPRGGTGRAARRATPRAARPEPSSRGATATCMVSTRSASRNSRTVATPPPSRTSLPSAASLACSSTVGRRRVDEVERGVGQRERGPRVVGEHEHGGVERRVVAPPALPLVVLPRATLGPNLLRPMISAPMFRAKSRVK